MESSDVGLRTSMAGGGAQGFLGTVKHSVGGGLFMTEYVADGGRSSSRLIGPGWIWLQTPTLPNLAHASSPYLPKAG